MDKDTEKYYEQYFDLFSRPGWNQFMEDLAGTEVAALELCASQDSPEVFRAQGELALVRRLLNFAELQKQSYEYLKDEEAELNATL